MKWGGRNDGRKKMKRKKWKTILRAIMAPICVLIVMIMKLVCIVIASRALIAGERYDLKNPSLVNGELVS